MKDTSGWSGTKVKRLYQGRLHQLTAVILVAATGVLALSLSNAATPTASVEPENGTASGNVTVLTDASGSGGKAVQFNSASANQFGISILGNRFVNQNGQTVQLRGVNRSGTQYVCAEGSGGVFDGPSDNASLDAMKSWHINAVRVNGNESCWLGINGAPTGGAAYRNALIDYVNRITAKGMYVIFDLHHSAPGSQLALDLAPMADRDHSPAYWTSAANAFKNNPAVIFDLYNEPYPDSNRNTTAAWVCMRDGGTCPGVPFTAAGMQELVNAVRATGATNPLMIAGPQYAGVVDKWVQYKPNDPLNQLAASIHIYYNIPSDPEWAPCYAQSCWENTMAPLAQQVPVVIGELGEHDCNHGLMEGTAQSPQQQSILDWSDAHGVSYLGWAWFTGNCAGEPAMISNYIGTPTLFGQGFKDHFVQFPWTYRD